MGRIKTSHTIRVSALALVTALTAAAVPGCSLLAKQNVSDSLENISGNTPWYDTSVYDIDAQYSGSQYDKVTTEYLGTIGGDSAYKVSETSVYPSDFDWDNGDYSSYSYVHVDLYGKDGTLTKSIDIREKVNPLLTELGIPDAAYSYSIINICGDKLVYGFPGQTDSGWHEILIDPGSGEAELLEEIAAPSSSMTCYDSKYWTFGDDTIAVYEYLGYMLDGGSDMVLATGIGNSVKTVSFAKQTSRSELSDIEWMIKITGSEYLFKACAPYGLRSDLFILNTSDMTVKTAGDTYAWLDSYIDTSVMTLSYDKELGTIVSDRYGLATLDFDKQQAEYIFRFDYCNVNRYDVPQLSVVSYSDEQIVFAGSIDRSPVDYVTYNDAQIVVLDRADTNPNAGKDIIKVAVIGQLDYATAQACYEYNAAGNDCYAVLDERYIVRASADDTDAYLTELAEVEKLLTVDMNAGDGPDIILNAIGMQQLSSSDYLVDLSSCVPDEAYFENAFNAVRSGDGAIYQMPLTCGIAGISTDSKNVDTTAGSGLTYDEYPAFVDNVCNGDDPFDLTRLDMFCLCLENMSDCFYSEGDVTFDNDEFKDLAAFVNDNLSDPLIDPNESLGEEIMRLAETVTDHPACYTEITSFAGYLQDYKYKNINPAILGMPSPDGRGPALVISNSAAVNAKSKHTDACFAFVSVLLSPSIQSCYALDNKTPVSITAFEESAIAAMDAFNLELDHTASAMSDTDLAMSGLNMDYVTEEDIAYYGSLIASGDHLPYSDSSVMLIVREEIQPYLAGQKSIDEVIGIIENRVATVMNERG
ncbi:MAG: extracellular solute-binding protein [Clostridiales bacterium]|nr:extracellular solute-binding protein [Clostridiales bacterium]